MDLINTIIILKKKSIGKNFKAFFLLEALGGRISCFTYRAGTNHRWWWFWDFLFGFDCLIFDTSFVLQMVAERSYELHSSSFVEPPKATRGGARGDRGGGGGQLSPLACPKETLCFIANAY